MSVTLMVSVKVEDFARWKSVFDDAAPMREKMGIRIKGIYQDLDKENHITLISDYPSLDAAKAMLASPQWEENQKRSGVIGGFTVGYFNRVD